MIDQGAEQIKEIKYFTAPVAEDYPRHAGERLRQQDWLNAVSTIKGYSKIMGYFPRPRLGGRSPAGPPFNDPTELKPDRREKHTDVNIAVELLLDALDAKTDHQAILITGDTDLAPAVYAVQKGIVDRRLISRGRTVDVWLPPGGSDRGWLAYFKEQEHSCHVRVETITESMLAESLLPYEQPPYYTCPEDWRLPLAYLEEKVPEGLRPDRPHPRGTASA